MRRNYQKNRNGYVSPNPSNPIKLRARYQRKNLQFRSNFMRVPVHNYHACFKLCVIVLWLGLGGGFAALGRRVGGDKLCGVSSQKSHRCIFSGHENLTPSFLRGGQGRDCPVYLSTEWPNPPESRPRLFKASDHFSGFGDSHFLHVFSFPFFTLVLKLESAPLDFENDSVWRPGFIHGGVGPLALRVCPQAPAPITFGSVGECLFLYPLCTIPSYPLSKRNVTQIFSGHEKNDDEEQNCSRPGGQESTQILKKYLARIIFSNVGQFQMGRSQKYGV